MTQELECPDGYASDAEIPQLPIAIKKLGLASHHYGTKEKRKDFKDDFLNILKEFDSHKCDSVLFSSYTLKTNALEKLNLPDVVQDLAHIRAIFFEELLGVRQGKSCTQYHVWMKSKARWVQHICHQAFGTLKTDEGKAEQFVAGFAKKRASGNFALMLCGETNIIFRRPKPYEIIDRRHFLDVLPASVSVILNPVHDKMGHGFMNPKRAFLSQRNRIVVSVWNEGKLSKQTAKEPSRSLDAKVPWSLFEDGQKTTERIQALALPAGMSTDVRLAVLKV